MYSEMNIEYTSVITPMPPAPCPDALTAVLLQHDYACFAATSVDDVLRADFALTAGVREHRFDNRALADHVLATFRAKEIQAASGFVDVTGYLAGTRLRITPSLRELTETCLSMLVRETTSKLPYEPTLLASSRPGQCSRCNNRADHHESGHVLHSHRVGLRGQQCTQCGLATYKIKSAFHNIQSSEEVKTSH